MVRWMDPGQLPFVFFLFLLVPLLGLALMVIVLVVVSGRLRGRFRSIEDFGKKMDDKSVMKDLEAEVAGRMERERFVFTDDLFSHDTWFTTIMNVHGDTSKASVFQDLFTSQTATKPSAITEMLYVLSIGGLTRKAFRRIKGVMYSSTLKDNVMIRIKDGLMDIDLDGAKIGSVNLVDKRLLGADGSLIGSFEEPQVFVRGLEEADLRIEFQNHGKASLVLSRGAKESYEFDVPGVIHKIAKMDHSLDKKHRAFVLALFLFTKMRFFLMPVKSNSISLGGKNITSRHPDSLSEIQMTRLLRDIFRRRYGEGKQW